MSKARLVVLLSATGLLLPLLLDHSAAWAGADKHCNGDAPLRSCPGNDEFDRYGVHVLNSGADACAAMQWMTGWPAHSAGVNGDEQSEELTDIEHHAEVVAPDGTPLPERGIHQLTSQIEACWVLEEIRDKTQRPIKLRDVRDELTLSCPRNPANLKAILPALSAIGRVSVDPRRRVLTFFGVPLALVPHAGSTYLGISKAFAVTLHKRTGTYTVVLANGRSLTGSCDVPVDAR